MRSPSLVIDTDIHPSPTPDSIERFLPEPWKRRWKAGNRGPGHLGYWNPHGVTRSDTQLPDGTKIESDPHALVGHFMDPYGIEYGVLNPAGVLHFGNHPDADYAAAVCRALNKVVAEEWLPASPRLRSSISVSPQDPLLAAEEIHRCAEIDGFVQVLMCSGQNMPYGKRAFDPIYRAACEHGLPVAIHPGSEGVGTSGAPTAAGYPSTYFEWHTGLVGSYMTHLLSLVCEGTFIKFPSLKFVMIEAGMAWIPPLMWRLDKNWKALRQSTPWLEKPPSEYVYDHILLTTQPIEEPEKAEHLKQIISMFPVEKMLMFSSDFPHWDGDTPDFVLKFLPDSVRTAVMSETASRLYGIPAQSAQEAPAHA